MNDRSDCLQNNEMTDRPRSSDRGRGHYLIVESGKVLALISGGDLTHWLVKDQMVGVKSLAILLRDHERCALTGLCTLSYRRWHNASLL